MEENDFNTPDEFGPPAPAEEYGPPRVPNPAEPLDPFNANDAIRLDRLNQDWSQVEVESSTGDLSPFHADKLFGAMKGERERLLQKQQATKQRQQAEQQQSAMHANAFGQAVQQANAEHGAQNFSKAVARVTDPDGNERMYAPPGWQEIEPRDVPEASGLAEGESVPGATTGQASGLAESPEQAAPQLRSNPDGTHTVMIQDGENRAEVHYRPDASSPTGMRAYGRDEYDRNGQLVRPQPSSAPPSPDGSLSDAQRQDIQRKAVGLVGQPPPQFDRQGRPNGQYTEWMRRVEGTARRMETEQMSLNLARTKGQITSQNTQGRQTEVARQAEAKARSATYRATHDALMKQFDKFEAEQTPPNLRPAWAKDYESAMAEAERRTDSQMQSKYHRESHGLPTDQSAVPPKEGANRPAAAEQAQKFNDLMGKIMGPQDSGRAQPVTAEVGQSPSSIGPDRVNELGRIAEERYNSATFRGVGDTRIVGQMHRLLEKAHNDQRPLTIAERAWYERYHSQLQDKDIKDKLKLVK